MSGTRWTNTDSGWRCDQCGHVHVGSLSIADDQAHICPPMTSSPSLRDRLAEATVSNLRIHFIECTGPGEVTCGACRERGWMSWFEYRKHIADELATILSALVAEEQRAAWDEGFTDGRDYETAAYWDTDVPDFPNPYAVTDGADA